MDQMCSHLSDIDCTYSNKCVFILSKFWNQITPCDTLIWSQNFRLRHLFLMPWWTIQALTTSSHIPELPSQFLMKLCSKYPLLFCNSKVTLHDLFLGADATSVEHIQVAWCKLSSHFCSISPTQDPTKVCKWVEFSQCPTKQVFCTRKTDTQGTSTFAYISKCLRKQN